MGEGGKNGNRASGLKTAVTVTGTTDGRLQSLKQPLLSPWPGMGGAPRTSSLSSYLLPLQVMPPLYSPLSPPCIPLLLCDFSLLGSPSLISRQLPACSPQLPSFLPSLWKLSGFFHSTVFSSSTHSCGITLVLFGRFEKGCIK